MRLFILGNESVPGGLAELPLLQWKKRKKKTAPSHHHHPLLHHPLLKQRDSLGAKDTRTPALAEPAVY